MTTPVFNPEYFRKRNHLSWRGSLLATTINNIFKPRTVMDFGCATGDLIKGFLDLGVNAHGIDKYVSSEHLLIPFKRLYRLDITQPLPLPEALSVDLAICVEVLGVVPWTKHDIIARNMTKISSSVLCCAAPELRVVFDDNMEKLNFKREEMWEEEIKRKIFYIKHRLAVKAFYNGLSIWRRV